MIGHGKGRGVSGAARVPHSSSEVGHPRIGEACMCQSGKVGAELAGHLARQPLLGVPSHRTSARSNPLRCQGGRTVRVGRCRGPGRQRQITATGLTIAARPRSVAGYAPKGTVGHSGPLSLRQRPRISARQLAARRVRTPKESLHERIIGGR